MTMQPPKRTRPVLDPSLVRDILEGVGRDRPELLRDSALRAPTAPMPARTSTPDEPTLDGLIADLLVGINDPGPTVRALAHRVGRSIQRGASLDAVLDRVPEVASAGSWLDLHERLARLRDIEDVAVQRGLLILDALRDRRLLVTARAVDCRRGRRRR
jgi:hypothetical protein